MVLMMIMPLVEAQTGKIVYNEKVKIDIKVDGDANNFRHMMPRERTFNRVLVFSPTESIYLSQPRETTEDDILEEMNGAHMRIRIQEPDEKYYSDLSNGISLEEREFMSRKFLIESKIDSMPWKITGKSREILGYPCLEASATVDSIRTYAWFTPSIPVSAGPGKYKGLPGMILEVIVNEGKRVITAASVKLMDVLDVADQIIKPKQGKKVTREEFDKIVADKTKEMSEENGNRIMFRVIR